MSRECVFDRSDPFAMPLDVPFVPTGERVVQAMLKLAAVDAGDVVYDLGSGDGRIVVAAARDHGAQAVGVEIDRVRVERAEAYAARAGVADRVSFIEYDLFHADFSPATVVTMYLLNSVNLDLRPRLLKELRPGTRVVSHDFDMGDWTPDRKLSAGGVSIFLWMIPARVAGTWGWEASNGRRFRVRLRQTWQRVEGEAWIDDRPARFKRAVLWGDWLELVLRPAGAAAPKSVFMRCGRDHWVGFSGKHKGAVASRLCADRPDSRMSRLNPGQPTRGA